MQKFMTEDARVVCKHENGVVGIVGTQRLVTVNGRKVLVDNDPEGRPIAGCPNVGATIKPCTSTLKVAVGYSTFIQVDGRRVCLDTVTGLTDGTPPGTVVYEVRNPGQTLVSAPS
jgi:hypothetical protein